MRNNGIPPLPPPPGVRVAQLGPDDTKTVSNLRCMLEQLVPTRARPWLTCVGPKREGKGV